MLSKKGQITIFIIIGIIIVFAFALFFYIRGLEVEKKVEITRPIVEKVPSEFNPILLFTEGCLESAATNGLIKLGQQGGYIYPEAYGDFSFIDPTDADGLIFSEGSKLRIPYWYYNEYPNDGSVIRIASMKPPLYRVNENDNSIEAQLDRYIETELKECLGDYSVFKAQGFSIEEAGGLNAQTTIIPGALTVLVDYPIDVRLGASERRISQFFASVDVDLVEVYEIAGNITNAETEYAFLEHRTLSLLEIFSGADSDKLPPMTESTFDFVNTVFWTTPSVEQNIKSMLMSYIPVFRFYGSRNFYEYDFGGDYEDVKQRVYDNMIIDLNKRTDLEVRFDYLDWWPIYLYINGGTGLIQPQSASVSFAGLQFGMQRYKTVYDLSYPVLVTLRDPVALGGQGYTFNFALEANIRNNLQVHDADSLPPVIAIFEESMLCNLNQRNSANYTISARDNYDDALLDDVQITFTIGDETCLIGVTASDFVGSFPIAYGGIVTLTREGYLSKSILFDAKPSKVLGPGEDIIELGMDRFETINVSVKKKKVWKYVDGKKIGSGFQFTHPDKKTGWFFEPAKYSLRPWEQAIVTLNRIDVMDEDYTVAFSVYGDEPAEVQIVPGRYEVSIQLLLHEFVKIPARSQKECVKYDVFGKCTKEQVITIPEVSFDIFPNGELVFDSEATYWNLGNNLYTSREITLFAVSPAIIDIPEASRFIEDLSVFEDIPDYSTNNREDLEPEFS